MRSTVQHAAQCKSTSSGTARADGSPTRGRSGEEQSREGGENETQRPPTVVALRRRLLLLSPLLLLLLLQLLFCFSLSGLMNGNLLQIFNCYTQCSEAQSAQTHIQRQRDTDEYTQHQVECARSMYTHTQIRYAHTLTQVNRQSACRAEPTTMMMMMLCMRMMMIMLPADAPNKCATCVDVVVVGPLIMKFDNDVALRLPDRLLAATANIADTRPVFRNYFKQSTATQISHKM